MYPNNFFMPMNNTMRMVPNGINMLPQRSGGILSTFKSINWGNLLNNANKTLNVVNQTIPLVRQAGPMLNNMKSMIKLASAFKDETDINEKKNNTINDNTTIEETSTDSYINNINSNSPNFFI